MKKDMSHYILDNMIPFFAEDWQQLKRLSTTDLLNEPTTRLPVSVHTKNGLFHKSWRNDEPIITIGELVQYSAKTLLGRNNIGKAAIKEIEFLLSELGLSLVTPELQELLDAWESASAEAREQFLQRIFAQRGILAYELITPHEHDIDVVAGELSCTMLEVKA